MINAKRRFKAKGQPLENVLALNEAHPAVLQGRTLYSTTVRVPDPRDQVLKSGNYNYKLGSTISKGRWKGFPLYSLNLEERATCPRSCNHWHDCYGNHMPFADRWIAGPTLLGHLEIELDTLHIRYCAGFAVRLHNLGDFYSVEYVRRWAEWLDRFPTLHCFGFTHWQQDTAIGAAISALRDHAWERFAIRFSDTSDTTRSANTIYRNPETPMVPEGIVCPAQTKRTECCGTCGLCWTTDKNIAFIAH